MTKANPSGAPVGGPAGYSGTPLYRKLGVVPGHRVLVIAPPPTFSLDLLDAGGAAELVTRPEPAPPGELVADVVLLFCPDAAAMAARLPATMAGTAEHGRCWVAWPKQASKVPTDLTENAVRGAALVAGWVDVKVCAIDVIWSGLCLMRRVQPRPRTVGRRA